MTQLMEVRGLDDLDANLAAIVTKAIHPQSGIVAALDDGLKEAIIPEIRRRIYEKFNVITGEFPAGVTTKKVNQYRVDLIVERVYAAVQEYGGTFTITPRQRAFFWDKWTKTHDEMWKALALSTTYTIPPRPYFRPGIDAKSREAVEITSRQLEGLIASAVK